MHRLLGPNEAKFWLLDWVAPMNSVIVVQRTGRYPPLDAPRRFAVPVVHAGVRSRPRWGDADRPGVLERQEVADDMAWLSEAQRLLRVRVGSAGHPPWHAVVQHDPGGFTLLLAVNHALTDWRTGLLVASAFLADEHPGPLAPPCEEMLPAGCFAAADADALIDAWWSSRATARWEALGLEALTAILPRQGATRFSLWRLTADETARLQGRCEAEGVSLNGALAIALRDTMQIAQVAHSVDMNRFIRPPPPLGPGLAVAHVFTAVTPGPFWDAARDNRADLFGQIRDGAAGDMLLALPKLLLGGAPDYQPAAMTITGAPTVGRTGGTDADTTMRLVMSSARGGGSILIISMFRDCLQLIAGAPADGPEVPLNIVASRLMEACA
nr:hypothetical protein [uncultured Rhodopila sp.]